jgi:hypothetical protein
MNRIIVGTLIVITSLFMLSSSNILAQEPCTADFDCNGNVDADDVTTFLSQFGRSPFNNPCPDCYDSPCPPTIMNRVPPTMIAILAVVVRNLMQTDAMTRHIVNLY